MADHFELHCILAIVIHCYSDAETLEMKNAKHFIFKRIDDEISMHFIMEVHSLIACIDY
jgi:hypothetical protein